MDSLKRILLLLGGIIVMPGLGLLLSQYAPIFGDSWAKMAAAWSPAKMSLISAHVITFLVLGVVGAIVGAKKFTKPPVKTDQKG